MKQRSMLWMVLLLVILAGIIQFAPELVNPGPLSKGHQKLTNNCFACHTPLQGPSRESCLFCHKPSTIGAGKSQQIRFHQSLTEPNCMACHTDHQGQGRPGSTRQFSHDLLPKEKQSQCKSCHLNRPKDTLHANIQGECRQCHTMNRWQPATFNHSQYFRFDRHHPADCASCHPAQNYKQYTCYECHEHSPSKVKREHWEEGIRDFQTCTTCHRSGDEDEAERIWDRLRRQKPPQTRFDNTSPPAAYPSYPKSDQRRFRGGDHDDDHDDDDHDDDHDDD